MDQEKKYELVPDAEARFMGRVVTASGPCGFWMCLRWRHWADSWNPKIT